MYQKSIIFPNITFNIKTNHIDSFQKQITHLSHFYIPYFHDSNQHININYLEDEQLYHEIIMNCSSQTYILHQSFQNQVHKEYSYNKNIQYFIIDNQEYVCMKTSEDDYTIITDGRSSSVKWPFRIIREILVRKNEEKGALFMHATGITLDDKGVLILGNSGSGKTTLAIQLLASEETMNFLSNDRVFLYDNNTPMMEYFPIPIVFAMGTVKGNPNLDEYFKKTRILERETNKSYENSSNKDKVPVPLTDLEKIFSNIGMKSENFLNCMIFSKLNLNDSHCFHIRELSDYEKQVKINQTCFTPFDWESLRLPWIYYSKTNPSEIIEKKIDTIYKIIEKIPIVELEYGLDTNPKKLVKKIKEI